MIVAALPLSGMPQSNSCAENHVCDVGDDQVSAYRVTKAGVTVAVGSGQLDSTAREPAIGTDAGVPSVIDSSGATADTASPPTRNKGEDALFFSAPLYGMTHF